MDYLDWEGEYRMDLITFQDAEGFLAKAQVWLEEHEAENNLILGIVIRLQETPERIQAPPFLGSVQDVGVLLIVAMMTPPFNLVLSGQPDADALKLLAERLVEQSWSVPGVVGPKDISQAFGKTWEQVSGKKSSPGLRMRLYKLSRVRHPAAVPGKLRIARLDDIPLITDWYAAFQKEALQDSISQEDARIQAERLVSDQYLFLWENGEPVSMAASTRHTRNGITVNYVYTPPHQRKKGYASACVAALSQKQLDSGYKFCCLFTDLTNPTSNQIYSDIGYHPVCDFEEQKFLDQSTTPG
jgi:uncharacterized protein